MGFRPRHHTIVLCQKIGNYVEYGGTIAFVPPETTEEIINFISAAFDVEPETNSVLNDLMTELYSLFTIAMSEDQRFDASNRLFEISQELLYRNHNENIKKVFLDQANRFEAETRTNNRIRLEYASWIRRIADSAIKSNDIETFERAIAISSRVFCSAINNENDIKLIASYYSLHVFNPVSLRLLKSKYDRVEYYDCVLAATLSFAVSLIKANCVDAVLVLTKNTLFSECIVEDMSIFSCKFAYGLLYALELGIRTGHIDTKKEETPQVLKDIIFQLFDKCLFICDPAKALESIARAIDINSTRTDDIISDIPYSLERDPYKNYFTYSFPGPDYFLWIALSSFSSYICFGVECSFSRLRGSDTFLFQSFFNSSKSGTPDYPHLLQTAINYNNEKNKSIIDLVESAWSYANNKRIKEEQEIEIDESTAKQLEEDLRAVFAMDSPLIRIFESEGKILENDTLYVQGEFVSYNIEKTLIADNQNEWIVENCSGSAAYILNRSLYQELKTMAIKEPSLDAVIENVDENSEYIALGDIDSLEIVESYRYKNIETIEIDVVDCVFLIRKTDLPVLLYGNFSESDIEPSFVHNHVYYRLYDLNKDSVKRKQLMDHSIDNKADLKEQEERLKTNAHLVIGMPIKFRLKDSAVVYTYSWIV